MTQEQFEELLEDATDAVAGVLKQAKVRMNFADNGAISDALEEVLRDITGMEGE